MFQKSILRAIAIDGGVGLGNPTRVVDLLEEFCKKSTDLGFLRNMGFVSTGITALSFLGGAMSPPLALLALVCNGAGIGFTLKHSLSANDERELSLLNRHRSLIHALSGVDLEQTELILCKWEELISSYSVAEDVFYLDGSRIDGRQIATMVKGAIATSATSAPVLPSAQPQPTTPQRFSLSQLRRQHALPPAPGASATNDNPFQLTQPIAPGDAPNLLPSMPVKDRMQLLLKAMAESGFPIGSLLNHPFCWFWGRSQSGKTTAAILLAIARLAMGHKVSYFSTDTDYPKELHWQRVEDSPAGYQTALADVAEIIGRADKNALRGNSWIFDEMYAAHSDHQIELEPLLRCVLMKGSKSKGGVIGISQVDTSGAHGLKNIDAAWRDERASVQAIHQEDEEGERSPTGRYLVSRGGATEEWRIPDWMLTDTNEYGDPDPVVWVLSRFPELLTQTYALNSQKGHSSQIGDSTPRIAESTELRSRTNPESILNRPELNQNQPGTNPESTPESNLNLYGLDPKSEQITLQERGKVIEIVRSGEKIVNNILATVWGVKPGGSQAYKTARSKLQQILQDAGIQLS